ncbi:689_t:CDS:2 [Acaulospora morrowiae]|uniref:689_t:CDS:1 n=1 Tax=Acaulospora morrowiae TaxID=94023 RepID=A0A9N9B8R8_9GLOM|nr:689_t:CDS:2 [Acaulospora morrowiae]
MSNKIGCVNSISVYALMDTKVYISYNQVHQLIKDAVEHYRINEDYKPDLMIAIGGGGFVPARILPINRCIKTFIVMMNNNHSLSFVQTPEQLSWQRSFLKRPNNKNIPIQAIGLSLYEDLGVFDAEQADAAATIGTQVVKTQWLHFGHVTCPLLGKNILIVDEVDDTRTTLAYAIQELSRDINEEKLKYIQSHPGSDVPETKLAVFVLHNKKKQKRMELPDQSIIPDGRYFAAKEVPDKWLVYPWEAIDISEHTQKSLEQEEENAI